MFWAPVVQVEQMNKNVDHTDLMKTTHCKSGALFSKASIENILFLVAAFHQNERDCYSGKWFFFRQIAECLEDTFYRNY